VPAVKLLPIDESGTVPGELAACPAMLRENCALTAAFYKVVGFAPPWIGYISMSDGQPVGGAAFKGAPCGNRVEIAYYTLPELERRGFATATVKELVRVARTAQPGLVIAAQTLPAPNASNAILEKLGFSFEGSVVHPEDGEVWEWELAPGE
jgi:ribosomal-protein-alanine N-acetyltransferase